MSRAEVKEIVLKSRMLGWSNSWLHHTYLRLLEDPIAQPGAAPIVRIPTPKGI